MLIVGLGNPGERYARTRHNVGFMWLDELARRFGAGAWRSRWDGKVTTVRVGRRECTLLKPQTYMNRSGQAVQAAMAGLRKRPEEVLVAHDELDLAFGVLRLKSGGGHAGNNGVRSIIEHIGADRWRRLRIGIGHPGKGADVAAWVLAALPDGQRSRLPELFDRATAALERVVGGNWEDGMRWLHEQPPLLIADDESAGTTPAAEGGP